MSYCKKLGADIPVTIEYVNLKNLKFKTRNDVCKAHEAKRLMLGLNPFVVDGNRQENAHTIHLVCKFCTKGRAQAMATMFNDIVSYYSFVVDIACDKQCGGKVPHSDLLTNMDNMLPSPGHPLWMVATEEEASSFLQVYRVRRMKSPYMLANSTADEFLYVCPDPYCTGAVKMARNATDDGLFRVLWKTNCTLQCWANIKLFPRQVSIHNSLWGPDGASDVTDVYCQNRAHKMQQVSAISFSSLNHRHSALAKLQKSIRTPIGHDGWCVMCHRVGLELGFINCHTFNHPMCSVCAVTLFETPRVDVSQFPSNLPIWLPEKTGVRCPCCLGACDTFTFRGMEVIHTPPCGFVGEQLYWDAAEFKAICLSTGMDPRQPMPEASDPTPRDYEHLHGRQFGDYTIDTSVGSGHHIHDPIVFEEEEV